MDGHAVDVRGSLCLPGFLERHPGNASQQINPVGFVPQLDHPSRDNKIFDGDIQTAESELADGAH